MQTPCDINIKNNIQDPFILSELDWVQDRVTINIAVVDIKLAKSVHSRATGMHQCITHYSGVVEYVALYFISMSTGCLCQITSEVCFSCVRYQQAFI